MKRAHVKSFNLHGLPRLHKATISWLCEVREWPPDGPGPAFQAVFRTRKADCNALGEAWGGSASEAIFRAIQAYFVLFPEDNQPAVRPTSTAPSKPALTLDDLDQIALEGQNPSEETI